MYASNQCLFIYSQFKLHWALKWHIIVIIIITAFAFHSLHCCPVTVYSLSENEHIKLFSGNFTTCCWWEMLVRVEMKSQRKVLFWKRHTNIRLCFGCRVRFHIHHSQCCSTITPRSSGVCVYLSGWGQFHGLLAKWDFYCSGGAGLRQPCSAVRNFPSLRWCVRALPRCSTAAHRNKAAALPQWTSLL